METSINQSNNENSSIQLPSFAEINYELFLRYKKGDLSARTKIIEKNLGLVASIARSFSASPNEQDDLFQVGCIGLIKAIDNFELSYEVKLSTYAVPLIIGEIKRYRRDNSYLHISRQQKEMGTKISFATRELEMSLQRTPTIDEIAEYLGVDRETVTYVLCAIQEPVSLYTPASDTSSEMGMLLVDKIGVDIPDSDDWVDNIAIKEALKHLPEDEGKILYARYFLEKTQGAISKDFGCSQVQISRKERDALYHIKKLVK